MAAHHGYAPATDAWARARLTRGSSSGEIWEINGEYREARLTLGADPSAGWSIEAHGVRAIHCELFWDGQALWIADTQQVGGVFLDGQRVGDWLIVRGPAEIRFGQAAIDVETSPPGSQRMASDPVHARPITVTDAQLPAPRQSRPVYGGAAGDSSVPDIEGEATRTAHSPASDPDGARTEMVRTPESRGGESRGEVDLRPRLGGAQPVVSAKAGSGKPVSAEATRMVSIPAAPAPPPGVPYAGSLSPVVAPPPSAPAMPAAPGLAALPAPMAPLAAAAPMAPAAPADPAAPMGAGFAPPPESSKPPEPKPSPFARILAVLKPEESTVEGKQAMPLRTWILFGVTVLVTVGWLLWDDTPEPAAPPPVPEGAFVVTQAAPPDPAPDPVPEPEATPDVEVPPEAQPPVADPSVAAAPESDGDDAEGPTLQRRAADAYLAGRYADALALYQRLAERQPGQAAYEAMARILARRVRDGCREGNGGEPCEP